MTTKIDDYEKRINNPKLGLGRELSVGTSSQGMQDPNGEYPKREYNFSPSLNKAALGTQVNELYTGGGEIGVSLNLTEQLPSQFPFNQVDETPSGHSIEMDDTPGGERILIRHNLGSGVELRADGSVLISALNNKIEVTGGDQTVIVEGHGNLVYNGNLNLKVSGNMSVEVGGDYNLDVAGNSTENIGRNYKKQVTGDTVEHHLRTKYEKILGNNVSMKLSDDRDIVKGEKDIIVHGSIDMASAKDILFSGKNQIDIISNHTYITGKDKLKVQGTYGMIGGAFVRYTGQTYSGAQDQNDSDDIGTAIFHGTFKGTADKALHAQKANTSVSTLVANLALVSDASLTSLISNYAVQSTTTTGLGTVTVPAVTPPTAAPVLAGANTITGLLAVSDMLTAFPQYTEQGHVTVEPNTITEIFESKIVQTDAMYSPSFPTNLEQTLRDAGKPLQTVIVDKDDLMRKETKGREHYQNNGFTVFLKQPTIGEIRSAFRNLKSRVDTASAGEKEKPSNVATLLIAEGKLNPQYLNKIPKGRLGRSVGIERRVKHGHRKIGNSK